MVRARQERAATSMTRWHRLVPRTRLTCPCGAHVPDRNPGREFHALRCPKCQALLAVWRMLDRLALVAEIQVEEYRVVRRKRMGAAEAALYIGVLRLPGEQAA